MSIDLHSAEGLLLACKERLSDLELNYTSHDGWMSRLSSLLADVTNADLEVRSSLAFQRTLWQDENPVSAVGQGRVSVDAAVEDPEFRSWLARESLRTPPSDPSEQVDWFVDLFQGLLKKLSAYCKRKPRLKALRVLAAFFPEYFTSVCNYRSLRDLHRAILSEQTVGAVRMNLEVVRRLNELLGPPKTDPKSRAIRLALPWQLLKKYVDSSSNEGSPPDWVQLDPLPAIRRRKGLTAIKGGFNAVPAMLELIHDGATRSDLIEFLRAENPAVKNVTLNQTFYVLRSELGVVEEDAESGRLSLTPSGESLLETGDPDELADWLLTKVLGVDHALFALRDEPRMHADLLRLISDVNPGWTSEYPASSILNWLLSLELVERLPEKKIGLTKTGKAWARQIHWKPEYLPQGPDDSSPDEDKREYQRISPPSVAALLVGIETTADPLRLEMLHRGLWLHHQRHFAVLTGLSGSGKTSLAVAYAKALCKPSNNFVVIPVEPGWHDPGALLGYSNPLADGAYSRTPFLDLLLRATEDPTQPYVAILDEMNLSHPEQYLAPLLSAMEIEGGGLIYLHSGVDDLEDVPPEIRYPSNLCLIGTVNMDETTHGLSDKVLDRAYVQEYWDTDLVSFQGWDMCSLSKGELGRTQDAMTRLYDALRPARMHFGYRTLQDVLGFLQGIETEDSGIPFDEALDEAVYAKVLPKLRGEDSPRFRAALANTLIVLNGTGMRRCASKVRELQEDLESTGTARFWR